MKQQPKGGFLAVGLTLFALFFGAGNLIFPPVLGQEAGTHLGAAIFGFILTGVGLPLLAVTALAINGGDFQKILRRIHPLVALGFFVVLYLAIGPLFGIPRTGNVAFEVGIYPLIGNIIPSETLSLLLFTIIYFVVSFWLALHPSKLVQRIGTIITPIILVIFAFVFIINYFNPIGTFTEPVNGYTSSPLLAGFTEGYLTLDALAALVYGVMIIATIRQTVGSDQQQLLKVTTIKAATVAGIGLAVVYSMLAYLGATSTPLGTFANGGQLLSAIVDVQLGFVGVLLLGIAVSLACLTTSVGLLIACSQYFSKLFAVSYRTMLLCLTLFAFFVSNVGLSALIELSLPLLTMIYPLTIVIIVLSLADRFLQDTPSVYAGGLIGAAVVSIYDGMLAAGIDVPMLSGLYQLLPFFEIGAGWVTPALVGMILGFMLSKRD